MDELKQIKRFSFSTTLVGVTNEDNISAVELNAANTRKVNECVAVINMLCDKCNTIMANLNIEVENEELKITFAAMLEQLKKDSVKLAECTVDPFSSNAMSALEAAACTTKHVNQCARITNELAAAMQQIETAFDLKVENEELIFNTGV